MVVVIDEEQTEEAVGATWVEVLAGEQRAAVVLYGEDKGWDDDNVVTRHRVADCKTQTVGGATKLENEAAISGRNGAGVVQEPAAVA